MKNWDDFGIDIKKGETGQIKLKCPLCSHTRKKNPDEQCLSVNIEEGIFHCFNCGWKGGLNPNSFERKQFVWSEQEYKKPEYSPDKWQLTDVAEKFFSGRGISRETLEANMIGSGYIRFRGRDSEPEHSISYPFFKNGEIVNVQFRSIEDKNFRMVKGAEKPFYGLNHIIEDNYLVTDKLIIVEGMNDKLALYEAGIRFAVSVPNGSPFEEEGKEANNPKLRFLDDPDFQFIVENVSEIIFVTDTDHQGIRLRDTIAERFGTDRCRIVSYPADCKDINDVLMKYGEEKVVEVVANASMYPTVGIITVSELTDKILALYSTGITKGWSTGFENLDEIFTVKESYLSTWTGVPEVGKSTVLNNIAINIGRIYNINTALFSPENRPVEVHTTRLAQIYLDKPFGYPNMPTRMSRDELMEAIFWIDNHFKWLQPKVATNAELLNLARISVLQNGSKLIIIDPYAAVMSGEGKTEHDFIKDFLSEWLDFAVKFNVHVAVVAHPTKMKTNAEGEWDVPNAYDVSGSAHWYNKSDFIVSLWRSNKSTMRQPIPIEFHVQKSKVREVAQSKQYRLFGMDFNTDKYFPYYGKRRMPIDLELSKYNYESYGSSSGEMDDVELTDTDN